MNLFGYLFSHLNLAFEIVFSYEVYSFHRLFMTAVFIFHDFSHPTVSYLISISALSLPFLHILYLSFDATFHSRDQSREEKDLGASKLLVKLLRELSFSFYCYYSVSM